MTYKLIIFDFDGTLADTYPWFLSVADQVSDAFNLKRLDRNRLDELRNLDVNKVLKYFDIPIWRFAAIGVYIRQLMTQDIHNISLFNGVDLLIQSLVEKDIEIALVSSNSYQNVCKVLGQSIIENIKYYECGVSINRKQAKFKKILSHSGIPSHQTLCIGDEIRDLRAAKAANIPFGAVSWGYTNVEALAELSPALIFQSVEEIYEKIILEPLELAFHPAALPA